MRTYRDPPGSKNKIEPAIQSNRVKLFILQLFLPINLIPDTLKNNHVIAAPENIVSLTAVTHRFIKNYFDYLSQLTIIVWSGLIFIGNMMILSALLSLFVCLPCSLSFPASFRRLVQFKSYTASSTHLMSSGFNIPDFSEEPMDPQRWKEKE